MAVPASTFLGEEKGEDISVGDREGKVTFSKLILWLSFVTHISWCGFGCFASFSFCFVFCCYLCVLCFVFFCCFYLFVSLCLCCCCFVCLWCLFVCLFLFLGGLQKKVFRVGNKPRGPRPPYGTVIGWSNSQIH